MASTVGWRPVRLLLLRSTTFTSGNECCQSISAQSVGSTPALIAQTVLLNEIAGVIFGWLYWQRSLEAATVAHATFHVPLVVLSLVQVALL